jgi:glycosyltransferase involved in cell wall biosynthesis/SAM-dependent methyltransferase
MRIAFYSPMPPSKSGIADYSAALVDALSKLTAVEVNPDEYDPASFDIALYQIGNNIHHAAAYRQALRVPGVVVMHEANLHHLIADMMIRTGDWDGYLREVEHDGGPEALAFAQRVRTLEVGPDYDGVPMLRRILENSRGVIVHSACVEREARSAGFQGPVAVIPHGAWVPEVDRNNYRGRLGVDADTPLVGIFGFLKPYKRITESLRAFKRLLRVEPEARMILVGEPHAEYPLQSIITGLGLSASVRVLGFTPIEEFVGYIAASDVVLNLRYPTVGESSGTLLRSLGLGRAVIVSEVGSFCEYPDDICLKVPVGATEEDTLFEYLNLLVSRPDLRKSLGQRARQWVARECNWQSVAGRYVTFLESVVHGGAAIPAETAVAATVPAAAPPLLEIKPEHITAWAASEDAAGYVRTHLSRLQRTLEITPRGGPGKRVLEMGAYLQITPSLQTRLGYSEVRGCYLGPLGNVDRKQVTSISGETFTCDVDLFDAEKDRFPYADESFHTVLCCELLEHLPLDPMHMMAEINRILTPGGHLVLTTPNICSFRALSAILQGYHPGFFPAYLKPGDAEEARHAREYAPREIASLFVDAGFDVELLETGEFRDDVHPEYAWVHHLLERYELNPQLRGDGIYAVGVKRGPVRDRYPAWLYS